MACTIKDTIKEKIVGNATSYTVKENEVFIPVTKDRSIKVAYKMAQNKTARINKEYNSEKFGPVVSINNSYKDGVGINIHVPKLLEDAYAVKAGNKSLSELEVEQSYRPEGFYKTDYALKEQEERELNDDNYTLFQLPNRDVREKAIKELDSYLLKFLEPFHFQSKQIDDMKKRFGIDSLGAVDLLHKMIYYVRESERNEETIPEEVGHAIVMLAGKDHPIIKQLLNNITDWSEFSEINREYSKIYNNIEKVKVEAVGKLIAKALVKNYKNVDQKQKSLLQRLFDWFKKLFIKTNSSFMLADKIAVEILKGNTDYIANLKPKEEKLNYDEALKGNDLAQSIIKDFTETSKNYLVGSLAIAGQGDTIYRSNSEPIHDLDFIQDGSDIENNKIINDLLNKRGAVPIHYGWSNENKEYTTYSYYIPAEGYRIEATDRERRNADNTGGWITEFNLINNSTNEIIFNARSFWKKSSNGKFTKQLYFNGIKSEDASKLFMPVDFFFWPNGFSELTKGIFSSSANIYLGKLLLSPLGGNEVMFDREKDQQDYVLHNPVNRESISNTKMSYYQVNDIKPGVSELFESNSELANAVYEAAGFEITHVDLTPSELTSKPIGSPLDQSEGTGICDGTCGLMAGRLQQAGMPYGHAEIEDKVANYHAVALTEIDGERYILNQPQHEFLSIEYQKAPLWERAMFWRGMSQRFNRHLPRILNDLYFSEGINPYPALFGTIESEYFGEIGPIFKDKKIIKREGYSVVTGTLIEDPSVRIAIKLEEGQTLETIDPEEADVQTTKNGEKVPVWVKTEFTPRFIKVTKENLIKEYQLTNKQADISIKAINEAIINPGTKTQITSQQKRQAQQLYSQYLNTIFPDSKVKDIVYHGSIYNNKQKFTKSTRVSGYYFAVTPNQALQHAERQLPNPKDANLYSILLNIKKPRIINEIIDYEDLDTQVKFTIGDEIFGYNADSIIAEKVEEYNTTYKTPESTWIEKQIIVFEPEQIHILGNKQDIEGFKEFVGNETKQLNNNSTGMTLTPNELSLLNETKELNEKIKCK